MLHNEPPCHKQKPRVHDGLPQTPLPFVVIGCPNQGASEEALVGSNKLEFGAFFGVLAETRPLSHNVMRGDGETADRAPSFAEAEVVQRSVVALQNEKLV